LYGCPAKKEFITNNFISNISNYLKKGEFYAFWHAPFLGRLS